jgi:hypothetical protein
MLVLATSATLVPAFALVSVGDIVVSLDGRFGDSTGRWGPMGGEVAAAISQEATAIGLPNAVSCEGRGTVGSAQLDLRSVDAGSPLAGPLLHPGNVFPGPGTIVVSSAAADRLGVGLGDQLSVQPSGSGRATDFQVAGVASDPDHLSSELVFLAPGVLGSDAVCHVLASDGPAIESLVRSDPALAASGAVWWPRSNESPLVVYRAAAIGAVGLVALTTIALLSAGLLALLEDLRPELATLLSFGLTPHRIRRFLRMVLAMVGAAVGAVGLVLGYLLERAVGPTMASWVDIRPAGGHVGWQAAAATVLVGAAIATVAGRRPIEEVVMADHTAERLGGVPRRGRRGSDALLLVGPMSMLVGGFSLVTAGAGASGRLLFGALVMAGGALGSTGLLLRAGATSCRRLGPVGRVAAMELWAWRRRVAPLMLVAATILGVALASGTVIGVVVERDRRLPVARPSQIVVTSADRWGEATFPGDDLLPTGEVSDQMVARLEHLLDERGTIADLHTVVEASDRPGTAAQVEWLAEVEATTSSSVTTDQVPIYVETDELVGALGLEPRPPDRTDVVEVRTGRSGPSSRLNSERVVSVDVLAEPQLSTTVTPAALISEHDAERLGTIRPVGVLVSLHPDAPIDLADEIVAVADEAGLFVARPADHAFLLSIRAASTAAGSVLVAIVMLTVGLILHRTGRPTRVALGALGASRRQLLGVDLLKTITTALAGTAIAVPVATAASLTVDGTVGDLPVDTLLVLSITSLVAALVGPTTGWRRPERT